jgi:hypothetical protein
MSAQHEQGQTIVVNALQSLSLNEMDLLFLASVANLEGRTLDEPQRAAKQAYRSALGRASVGAGHGSIAGCADIPDLGQIMVITSLRRLSDEDLHLLISGAKALEEGRPVSESEAVALQASRRERERLCEMAGLGSTEKHPLNAGSNRGIDFKPEPGHRPGLQTLLEAWPVHDLRTLATGENL